MVIPSMTERLDVYPENMTLASAYRIRSSLIKDKLHFEKLGQPIPDWLALELFDIDGQIFILTA